MRRVPASRGVVVALLLVAGGVGLRIVAASRPGLWADEIFSLAMATGHSLEHPAAVADTSLGDFAEPRGAVSPSAFRRFTEQESPPAGPRRVVRAVLLSDTSPPIYYLLLDPWTRLFGTGDAALRLFSVLWAVASLPLLWRVGREMGDSAAAWSAVVLFSLSPVALFYSAEGRMYALLWFASLALAWLTLRLSREGGGVGDRVLWVLAGVTGLLTHYFFAFVWAACAGWLLLRTRARRRWTSVSLAALTLVTVLPWYLQLPASLARWRVTEGWLDGSLPWPGAFGRPLQLAEQMLSGRTYLGGWEQAILVVGAVVAVLLGLLFARGRLGWLFGGERSLVWTWAAAACAGPLVFDVLRHTTTSGVPRYALSALPALVLLLAAGFGRLSCRPRSLLLGAMLLAWLPGTVATAFSETARPWQPYPDIARGLEARLGPDDLVILSSIPSGVIGVARYMDEDVPIASWVQQLDTREATDAGRLASGRRRVALAEVTHLGAGSQALDWLLEHGREVARDTFPDSSSRVVYFAPRSDDLFGSATGAEED